MSNDNVRYKVRIKEKGKRMKTDSEIRDFLGHNGGGCRVRISTHSLSDSVAPNPGDRIIYRRGSPDVFDRTKDFWAYIGTVKDQIREMERWD